MKSLFKQAASVACLPWLAAAAFNEALVVEFDGSVALVRGIMRHYSPWLANNYDNRPLRP